MPAFACWPVRFARRGDKTPLIVSDDSRERRNLAMRGEAHAVSRKEARDGHQICGRDPAKPHRPMAELRT